MKQLTSKLAQCKQWLIYYVRRMLPEHKCKYCGCMTRQPDSECYAKPKQAITPNGTVVSWRLLTPNRKR